MLLTTLACVAPQRGPRPEGAPLRLGDLSHAGDARRRASLELVLDGLEADAAGRFQLAASRYERAIQVDASNPYAYLALARHSVDAGEPEQALQLLDQTELLLESTGAPSPGASAHLVGLRGAALLAAGHAREAEPWLDEARLLAPDVWGDGRLSPEELR